MVNFKRYAIIDLHLHLDGALSPEAIIDVAKEENIELPTYDPKELKEYLVVPKDCKSLNEYLKRFDIPNLVLQSKNGLYKCTYDLLRRMYRQGLLYVEIRMAPQLSTAKGLTQDEVVESIIKASKDAKERFGIWSNFILCLMRGTDNKEKNLETVRVAKKYFKKGVVLLDLAGAEAVFPNKMFEEEFNLAKELKVPFTMHAGEAGDSKSVVDAVEMGAVRIGHGVHLLQDPESLKLIGKKKIPFEICPTSNLDTKAISSLNDLNLQVFLRNGIPVTINTDDPTVSNTTLANEYKILYENGVPEKVLELFTIHSIMSARLTRDEKEVLFKHLL